MISLLTFHNVRAVSLSLRFKRKWRHVIGNLKIKRKNPFIFKITNVQSAQRQFTSSFAVEKNPSNCIGLARACPGLQAVQVPLLSARDRPNAACYPGNKGSNSVKALPLFSTISDFKAKRPYREWF